MRIVLGLLLVGVLAFLYLKSQSGELRLQPQIATYLRQLRDIDAGWTRDMAAVRSDPLNAQARSRDSLDRLQPVLERLKTDTVLLGSEELNTGVEGLRQAFLEKQTQVEGFDRQVEALRKVLRDVLLQLAEVRQTASRVNAEAPVALRARLAPLDGQLVSLGAELLRLYVQPDDGVRHTVEASTAALVQQAEGLPEALRTPLVGLSEPVALILREEPALTQTAQQIELLPTGAAGELDERCVRSRLPGHGRREGALPRLPGVLFAGAAGVPGLRAVAARAQLRQDQPRQRGAAGRQREPRAARRRAHQGALARRSST